jgi:hypothetical protein
MKIVVGLGQWHFPGHVNTCSSSTTTFAGIWSINRISYLLGLLDRSRSCKVVKTASPEAPNRATLLC